ncbi:MAG: acyltransferase family protein [Bacteroidales bacterium]|nr:acyltransferase family protein [Bacteroidales bacterium]
METNSSIFNEDKTVFKRVGYLDLLKCLGMFIVVSGHIHTNYGWFSLPIHSYVIPLYFLLSGLTFKRNKFPTFSSFLKHRAKTLLMPYFMLSFVTWLLWASYNLFLHADVNFLMPLLQTFIAQGYGGYLVHNVPLWFVTCLFVIESMYYFIDKLPEKINVLICAICAIVGIFLIIGPWSSITTKLPWSIESAFAAIIFYCVGNVLTKHYSLYEIQNVVVRKKWMAIGVILVLTSILVICAHWNGHVSLGSDILGRSPLLFYINAFMGIVTIGLFAILVSSIKTECKIFNKIMGFHYWFGRNSFYIMATHVPIKGIIMVFVAKMLNVTVPYVGNDYLCCAFVFVVTCLLSSVAALLIGRIKKHDENWFDKIAKRN